MTQEIANAIAGHISVVIAKANSDYQEAAIVEERPDNVLSQRIHSDGMMAGARDIAQAIARMIELADHLRSPSESFDKELFFKICSLDSEGNL